MNAQAAVRVIFGSLDRRESAVQAIVDINGHGIAHPSGSYRNYYELDGAYLARYRSGKRAPH